MVRPRRLARMLALMFCLFAGVFIMATPWIIMQRVDADLGVVRIAVPLVTGAVIILGGIGAYASSASRNDGGM